MYSRLGLVDQSRGYVYDSTTATWVASPSPVPSTAANSTQVAASLISSSGVSMSTDTTPASTKQGLIVWPAGRANIGSTAADNAVTATIGSNLQSTSQPAAGSSGINCWNVGGILSSLGGLVTLATASTTVSIAGNSTVSIGLNLQSTSQPAAGSSGINCWNVGGILSSLGGIAKAQMMDSSNVTPNIVGTRPTTGAQAIAIREVLNNLQSTQISTMGNNSTSNTVVSSVAAQRIKVYAYSVTSTAQGGIGAGPAGYFGSSASVKQLWNIVPRAMSSGTWDNYLAVSPPAWLFATDAGEPLIFGISGATGIFQLNLSYFVEA